ncbi:hypothetical protein HHK36_001745 [Tetracentron sinense]|uniref:Uncharacterized protein n=1 Tax=Tetracentron sinense TaxID=13715 RepID=A0A835A491_TETSI|nr:hypothetical protein HHK36_001745 [Tetracentron sinense]
MDSIQKLQKVGEEDLLSENDPAGRPSFHFILLLRSHNVVAPLEQLNILLQCVLIIFTYHQFVNPTGRTKNGVWMTPPYGPAKLLEIVGEQHASMIHGLADLEIVEEQHSSMIQWQAFIGKHVQYCSNEFLSWLWRDAKEGNAISKIYEERLVIGAPNLYLHLSIHGHFTSPDFERLFGISAIPNLDINLVICYWIYSLHLPQLWDIRVDLLWLFRISDS